MIWKKLTWRLSVCCSLISMTIGCEPATKPEAEVPIPKAKSLDEEVKQSQDKKQLSSQPTEARFGGYRFSVPAGWEQKPIASDVLLGEFSIPGEEGSARLTISTAGGDLESNLQRWRGQFRRGPDDSEPVQSTIRLDGQEGTLLELTGTFTDMFSSKEPRKNWRMLGVAVPLGPTNFFVKLTGPRSTVDAQKEAFIRFVETAKKD